MIIEVGKSYVRQDGVVVEVVGKHPHYQYKFECSKGHVYTNGGRANWDLGNRNLILISEYQGLARSPNDTNVVWGKELRLSEAEARVKELELEITGWENDRQTEIDHYTAQMCEMQAELDKAQQDMENEI